MAPLANASCVHRRDIAMPHDPATAVQRSRNASKAARTNPSRELSAVIERFRVLDTEDTELP
jgi:hypothetical protein